MEIPGFITLSNPMGLESLWWDGQICRVYERQIVGIDNNTIIHIINFATISSSVPLLGKICNWVILIPLAFNCCHVTTVLPPTSVLHLVTGKEQDSCCKQSRKTGINGRNDLK